MQMQISNANLNAMQYKLTNFTITQMSQKQSTFCKQHSSFKISQQEQFYSVALIALIDFVDFN